MKSIKHSSCSECERWSGMGQGEYSVWKTDVGMVFKSSHFPGMSPDIDEVKPLNAGSEGLPEVCHQEMPT